MDSKGFFLVWISISSVSCCPGLYDPLCKSYAEFLTQNKGKVALGTDIILQVLDTKYARCGPLNIDIRELTIAKAQHYFRSGQLTSAQLTSCYLNRIRHMNPHLKAVIEVNPDAHSVATRTDGERKEGKTAGELHGIPILIKDNMATADKMQTTAGAVALEYLVPKEDSDVVKRIRAAGGVILGKTNPTEWAAFRGTQLPNGWSGRGGQTLSPYVLISDPSESSTGSAVAIAANLGLVALGTETDDSIIAPANVASLVGLKTTIGKVSVRGVIPISPTQDTVGPMTRSAADARIVLQAISSDRFHGRGSSVSVDKPKPQPYRLGVVRKPFWNSDDLVIGKSIGILESALAKLKTRPDVQIVDPVGGDEAAFNSVSGESEVVVLLHEFKYYVNAYLRNDVFHFENRVGRSISNLADVIKFNRKNPPPENYNQNILIESEATDGLGNVTYRTRRRDNIKFARDYLNSVLDGNKLDAMVTPCQSEKEVLFISYGAIAGYPYVTIPVGINEDGIPFGICFLGRPNSESILLNIGSILEQVHPGRQVPTFTFYPKYSPRK